MGSERAWSYVKTWILSYGKLGDKRRLFSMWETSQSCNLEIWLTAAWVGDRVRGRGGKIKEGREKAFGIFRDWVCFSLFYFWLPIIWTSFLVWIIPYIMSLSEKLSLLIIMECKISKYLLSQHLGPWAQVLAHSLDLAIRCMRLGLWSRLPGKTILTDGCWQ